MENKQEIDSKMDKKIIFLDVDDHLVAAKKVRVRARIPTILYSLDSPLFALSKYVKTILVS